MVDEAKSVRDAVSALLRGVSAGEVIQTLEQHYKTPDALRVKISLVKNACLRDPEMKRRVVEALTSTGIEVDASTPLRELVSGRPGLIPENVSQMRPSRELLETCRAQAQARLESRAESVLQVKHTDQLLHTARAALKDSESDFYLLALSLLLIAGRRSVEVLNRQASLTPTSCPHVAFFSGQAKKRGSGPTSFPIPVLADARDVVLGMGRLRRMQGSLPPLDNRKVSSLYASPLRRRLLSHPLFAQLGHVHALRAVYARLVDHLFDWQSSTHPNLRSKVILGHGNMEESLAYHVSLLDAPSEKIPTRLCVRNGRLEFQ